MFVELHPPLQSVLRHLCHLQRKPIPISHHPISPAFWAHGSHFSFSVSLYSVHPIEMKSCALWYLMDEFVHMITSVRASGFLLLLFRSGISIFWTLIVQFSLLLGLCFSVISKSYSICVNFQGISRSSYTVFHPEYMSELVLLGYIGRPEQQSKSFPILT